MKMTEQQAMQELLRYDEKTGEFWWTNNAAKKVAGKIANAKDKHGYICLKVNGKMYKAHRLAWYFVYGSFPEKNIDHINGNKSDNRICNLRMASLTLNMQNIRKAKSNSSTGLLGISKNGSGWRAEIRIDGKKRNLGTYKNKETAHSIYVEAKRKFHEGCTI